MFVLLDWAWQHPIRWWELFTFLLLVIMVLGFFLLTLAAVIIGWNHVYEYVEDVRSRKALVRYARALQELRARHYELLGTLRTEVMIAAHVGTIPLYQAEILGLAIELAVSRTATRSYGTSGPQMHQH